MSAPVSYRVSMPNPNTHLFEVQAHFPAMGDELIAGLPVWTPGSYLVREFSRHVQELKVTDMADRPLAFERLDKRSIRVAAKNAPVRLHYKVYANELTVRTSHLDATHGYFNGACLFFFVEGLRDREHRVAVHPPKGWRVTAPLASQGLDFIAKDYDELVDSPFEVGPHTPLTFTAAGVPHEVVLWGDPRLDETKLATDLARVVEEEARLMGPLPMKRYVFFIYGTDKGRGGLEHKASTALLYPRSGFSTHKGWEDFLTLASHEYFHLWNVKRLKPRRLEPFDYSKENYTQLLWWFEGATSYYDNLLVRRAGLMSPARYLTRLGESLTTLHTTPGRKVMPLVDASWLAWTKYYRPDENSPNSGVSYYVKGELVCLVLDLLLRKETRGQKSLDDVLRLLWQRYGDESGVPEDGVEAALLEVGGEGLKGFLDRALRGTDELDYGAFSWVGLEVRFRARESVNDKGGTPPRSRAEKPTAWLGLLPKGASAVATVLEGSPAQAAGLYADDEVVALDGLKCDVNGLISRCEDKKPGDVVRITVFRREKLTELTLTLGQRPLEMAWLARVEKPTEEQKTAFLAWTGAAWDELDTRAS